MDRDLEVVLEEMIALIPSGNESLTISLNNIKSSMLFSAPELMHLWWEETTILFQDTFTDMDNLEDWEKSVIDLYTDRSNFQSTEDN